MKLAEFPELLKVLYDLAREIKDNYQEQLAASGRYTTEYKLIDSVTTQVVVNERGYEITMNLNDYWKFVENDTKPHFPPPDKLVEWINIKPIIPRPTRTGNIPTPEQLAFLIGRKISEVGTKGSHDLEKTKDAIIPFFEQRIADALAKDMTNVVKRLIIE